MIIFVHFYFPFSVHCYIIIYKRNSLIYDYILNDCKSINSVCSIYDYPVENNVEAKSLYNKILKKINSNEYNNLKFSYNYSNNMVRIILIGDPNEINELIMC